MFAFLIYIVRTFKYWLSAFFFVNLLLALSASLKPYALKILVDFLTKEDAPHVGLPVLFYIFASLFTVVCFRLHNFVWIHLAPPMRHHVIDTLTKNVKTLPLPFFQNRSAANLGSHIQEISKKLPELTQTIFDGFLGGALTLLSATVAVGTISLQFAIGLLFWIFIFIVGSILILKRAKKIGEEGSYFRSKILSKIVEQLRNIRCIRLFDRTQFEEDKLNRILDTYLITDKKKERYVVSTYGFQGFSFLIYQTISLNWLMDGFREGSLYLGDITFILGINLVCVDYFRKISQYIVDFADQLGSIEHSFSQLLPPASTIKLPEGKLPISVGSIQFEKVSFQYEGSLPLFDDLSLNIEMGEKIAIIGRSGSGKSSFIQLILRLYDVSSGTIRIGGQDIQSSSLDHLRQMIGVVPQSPTLFEGTIRENIQYGKLDATEEEIVEAANQAAIHDFIIQLPLGYDTPLDSMGSSLSAGQRQRISIARALIKNAPILILDEPMTHLDTKTIEQIEDNLYKKTGGKILIVITHHLSPFLSKVDRILVFESGQIHNILNQKENQFRTTVPV